MVTTCLRDLSYTCQILCVKVKTDIFLLLMSFFSGCEPQHFIQQYILCCLLLLHHPGNTQPNQAMHHGKQQVKKDMHAGD